ncbi:MAG TPA: hypothetical protein VFQ51_04770 [Vicinamibacteria bacterium]|nr:hypothetical protein [Vicinamibacteria bacterium]
MRARCPGFCIEDAAARALGWWNMPHWYYRLVFPICVGVINLGCYLAAGVAVGLLDRFLAWYTARRRPRVMTTLFSSDSVPRS